MVRSTRSESKVRSLSRSSNKKGHPIYSREDIREQYCINSKELDFLEDGAFERAPNLFGCLSSSNLVSDQQSLASPCNKSSFIPDCVRRNFNFGSAHDSRKSKDHRRRKKDKKPEDGDDSDGGFKKQRPKPRICFIESQNKSPPARGHFSPPPSYGTPPKDHSPDYRDREPITQQARTLSQEAIQARIPFVSNQNSPAQPQKKEVCSHCRTSGVPKENSVRFCIKSDERRRSSSSSTRWQVGGRGAQVGPAPVQLAPPTGQLVPGIHQVKGGQYIPASFAPQSYIQGQPINLPHQHAHYHHYHHAHQPPPPPPMRMVPSPVPSTGQDSAASFTTCPIHRCPSGQSNSTTLPPFDPVNHTFARYYYYYRPLNSRVSTRAQSNYFRIGNFRIVFMRLFLLIFPRVLILSDCFSLNRGNLFPENKNSKKF